MSQIFNHIIPVTKGLCVFTLHETYLANRVAQVCDRTFHFKL